MNDPHVKALVYVVDPNETVHYGDAKPIESKRPGFHVSLEDASARFEFKEHYATVGKARAAVQLVFNQWMFEASTKSGQSNFSLRFGWPEIIDCQPDPHTPGIISIPAHFPGSSGSITAAVMVTRQYPPPSSAGEMDIRDPDVQTMLHRCAGHRQGHEPLSGTANFRMTMLEYKFKSKAFKGGSRKKRRVMFEAMWTYCNTWDRSRETGPAKRDSVLEQQLTAKVLQKISRAKKNVSWKRPSGG